MTPESRPAQNALVWAAHRFSPQGGVGRLGRFRALHYVGPHRLEKVEVYWEDDGTVSMYYSDELHLIDTITLPPDCSDPAALEQWLASDGPGAP
jgi:hypothetical protein